MSTSMAGAAPAVRELRDRHSLQKRSWKARALHVVVLAVAFAAVTEAAVDAATLDWEAKGAGVARASFALSTTTTGHGHSTRSAESISDLVVQAPISCANSATPAVPIDVQVIPTTIAVGPTGSFTSGTIRQGSGTSVSGVLRNGHVTLSYHHMASSKNQFDGGTEVCDTTTLRLNGAPGRRVSVADAVWQGQTRTNEPVMLNIVAGGRALQEPPHLPANGGAQASISFGVFSQSCFSAGCTPSSNDICAYETPTNVFINSDGSFGNVADTEGDNAAFTGRITNGHSASGTFVNGGEDCVQTTWTAGPQ